VMNHLAAATGRGGQAQMGAGLIGTGGWYSPLATPA